MEAVPAVSFYCNNVDSPRSCLYLNVDSGCNAAIYSSFDDNSSMFGSSWSDPYPSCASSYIGTTFFNFAGAAALPNEPQLVYPTEEDILFNGDTSEFLQQLHAGCNRPVMHPNLVHTLKYMVTPGVAAPEDQLSTQYSFVQERLFLDQQLPVESAGQMSPNDDGSLVSSQEVTVSVESVDQPVEKHEPPSLNMKRLEKVEDVSPPDDTNIEAAEVSVDLINNRRPFRCGQEGCNKTFKNPQTMKMHHKTHYSDGSAVGLTALPVLTPSTLKAGHNKKIPSRCPKCRKTFVGLYELRRHYGRKHSEGEKPFGCRKCSKKFYIEVDVRDHEKLCGEPIECKCGLKFAFKCNLVAHKKVHPACQEQTNSTNSSITMSDELDSGSPPLARHGIKRHRAEMEAASSHSSTYTPPAPDFKCLPDPATAPLKAARYDFAGLQFSTDGGSLWASNMHYPSVNFANLPVPAPSAMYSSVLGGLDQHLGSQGSLMRKLPHMGRGFHHEPPKFSHCDPAGQSAMDLVLNPVPWSV